MGEGSLLLIAVSFGRVIRVAHRFLLWDGNPCCSSFFFVLGGGSVLLNVFLLWHGDPSTTDPPPKIKKQCATRIPVPKQLGEGSLLLIAVSFGRVIRVAHRFLFWDGDPCCSLFFCFGRRICVAQRFFALAWGSVLLIVFFVLGGGFVLLNFFVL
jgi:hypothetical protein